MVVTTEDQKLILLRLIYSYSKEVARCSKNEEVLYLSVDIGTSYKKGELTGQELISELNSLIEKLQHHIVSQARNSALESCKDLIGEIHQPGYYQQQLKIRADRKKKCELEAQEKRRKEQEKREREQAKQRSSQRRREYDHGMDTWVDGVCYEDNLAIYNQYLKDES